MVMAQSATRSQQEFLKGAIQRLGMTRASFAQRISVPEKTLDKWLAPAGTSDFRKMPDMVWTYVIEILAWDAKMPDIPPLGVYDDANQPEILVKPSVALNAHRAEIRKIVESNRASNARVFGSVLRGEDTVESDLDLLVEPQPGMTLLNVGAIECGVSELLGVEVDVLTPNALPEKFRARVMAEAQPV